MYSSVFCIDIEARYVMHNWPIKDKSHPAKGTDQQAGLQASRIATASKQALGQLGQRPPVSKPLATRTAASSKQKLRQPSYRLMSMHWVRARMVGRAGCLYEAYFTSM